MTFPEKPSGDDDEYLPAITGGSASTPPMMYEEGFVDGARLVAETYRLRDENTALRKQVLDLHGQLQQCQGEVLIWQDMAQTFEQEAYTDEMTGKPNRRALIRQLEEDAAERPGEVGILFVDIDGLKKVNDTQGHAAGNQLIQTTLDILEQNLRIQREEPDTVARGAFRLSGDESVGRVQNIQDEEQLAIIKDRLIVALGNNGIQASIGYEHHQPGQSALDLIAEADSRMYAMKLSGKRTGQLEALENLDDEKRLVSEEVIAMLGGVGMTVDELHQLRGTAR